MKCDELIAHKADVTIPVYGTIADAEVYLKEKADAAIAELKARIADLEKLNHDLCERVTENDEIRLHWEEIEQTRAENERLKAKLESVQASAYADSVDAGMRERRLERALWLARALRARDIQRWWIAATCAPVTERACSVWNNVERKCRAKEEAYK